MQLDHFNEKREISRNSKLECEQLEILELNDTEYFDEEIGLMMSLLHDLAVNENISEKIQLLLATKVLDSSYSMRELRKYLVHNKNLSDATFEILLNQNDIFLFFEVLEFIEISDFRKNQIIKKLESLGLANILTTSDLYRCLHSFNFSEEVQNQILYHEYHLEYFVINPYLTDLVQLKIVQSQAYENKVFSSATYLGTSDLERSSDDDFIDVDDYHIESKDYKEYYFQVFAEKNKNISELALIALFNKNDKKVLMTLSKRTELPKVIIYKFIEKNDYDLIDNIIKFNVLDLKFQFMVLALNSNMLNVHLSKKEWIELDTVHTLANLNEVHILDNLISSKSLLNEKLRPELEIKFKAHLEYADYLNSKDDLPF